MKLKQYIVFTLALIVVLAPLSVLAAPESLEDPVKRVTIAKIGTGGGGGGSDTSKSLIDQVQNATEGLNKSDAVEVEKAATKVEEIARNRILNITDGIDEATDLSSLLHNSYHGIYPDRTLVSARTNLSIARGPTGLGDGAVALHRETGQPLNTSEELDVRERATIIQSEAPNAAKAGALMIYATIDALHYTKQALKDVKDADWEVVRGNITLLSMLNRRMILNQTDYNLTVEFSTNTTRALNAANNVTEALNQTNLWQALDVLAKSQDEVNGLTISSTVPAEDSDVNCSHDPLILVTADCAIILGPSGDTTYREMTPTGQRDHEKNVVLMDFGGNDVYRHGAGAGGGVDICSECPPPIQVLVDLGGGDDRYEQTGANSTQMASDGATHGSGYRGAGYLYDAGGNDQYLVRYNDHAALVSQGGAQAGAGMLVDESGNDLYSTTQEDDSAASAQGHAALGGVGILLDVGGSDDYNFILADQGWNGGGAQGSASNYGVGLLVDTGPGGDNFTAGQDNVQGAASHGGFGLLYDQGGASNYTIRASDGCIELRDSDCSLLGAEQGPIGGWAWGYADLNGTGAFVGNSQGSSYAVVNTGSDSNVESLGRALLGVGGEHGAGIFIEPGGDDIYSALNASHGFAYFGLGVFSDAGGDDVYECTSTGGLTCYGYADPGYAGVFVDEFGNDTYAAWDDRSNPWAIHDLGLGVRSN